MKMSFRWYGDTDPISLQYISQIPNMRSVVSAVYDVKPGEVWPEESIAKMKKQCEDNNLIFDIVESIPVHENIKLGRDNVDELIEVYCENIRRCAKYGIKCVTYNFMPVFDWTRTQLDKEAPDGSTSLVMYWEQMKGLDPLKDDIHLPGWDSSYTQEEVRELISAYGELGEEGLWANLEKFLKKVIPVAEECGVRMAIHPDDPPYPIFGIPRIITCEENLDRMLAIVDSPANSLCLCTGSLGCAASNDIVAMVKKYSAMDRIAFMHIRQVLVLPDGSFEEQGHLSKCGSLDMYEIVKALVETGFDGYVRPDHGRMIWGETGKPGYGLYDRALGATYINGLFEACEKANKNLLEINTMNAISEKIMSIGVVPVIKLNNPERDAVALAEALVKGGVPVAEVTFRAAGAATAIKLMSENVPEMLVGAGTVLTTAQVDEAIEAGAKFIVTPGLDEYIVKYCQEKNIPIYAGCTTPTDYHTAYRLGLDVLKFFPAEQSGGLAKIKAMSAPFPMFKVMPTGGIGLNNLKEYLSCPVIAACGGSYMVTADLIDNQKWDEIIDLCKKSVEIVKEARSNG